MCGHRVEGEKPAGSEERGRETGRKRGERERNHTKRGERERNRHEARREGLGMYVAGCTERLCALAGIWRRGPTDSAARSWDAGPEDDDADTGGLSEAARAVRRSLSRSAKLAPTTTARCVVGQRVGARVSAHVSLERPTRPPGPLVGQPPLPHRSRGARPRCHARDTPGKATPRQGANGSAEHGRSVVAVPVLRPLGTRPLPGR